MGVDGGWDGVTKATICLGRSCSIARWRRLMKPDFFTPTNVIEPLNSILRERKRHAHFERHLREFITERRGSIPIRRGDERQYRFRFNDPMMQPYVIVKGFIASTLVCPSGSRRLSSNIRASFCERTFARALPPLWPKAAAKVVHGARIEWGAAWHNGCPALTITRDNHRSGTRFTPRRAAGFNHQRRLHAT
jgi:hypothetical protein